MKYTICFMLLIVFMIQISGGESEIDRVVQTEKDFAQTASKIGIKNAFLQFLAEDSILFRPGPVNGKQWMEKEKEKGDLLTWQIIFAELSSSEDLAYTTGPWQYAPSKDVAPAAFGMFLTIWKKQTSGDWKAVVDLGTGSKQRIDPTQEVKEISRQKQSNTDPSIDFRSVDLAFAGTLKSDGTLKAYSSFLSNRVRLMRDGPGVILGKDAALQDIASNQQKTSFQVAGGRSSASKDLVYVYGTSENLENGQKGSFLRIWGIEEQSYKILVDVVTQFK